MDNKKVYFLSDVHLGTPLFNNNREREIRLTRWLGSIKEDCAALYLLGDIFDFWFEYKRVVPKGFVRFLSKICEFTDSGIEVHFFTGNHDIWAFDYLNKECGMIIHMDNRIFDINGKRFLIGHGDGLDPSDKKYLFLRKVFHNRFMQHCFRLIHPDCGIAMALKWSSHSRLENEKAGTGRFRGEEDEKIVKYCRKVLEKEHYDFFIFGHRHLPMKVQLTADSRYFNTGDWLTHYSYAVFDGNTVTLLKAD